jgi:hypothetical protein
MSTREMRFLILGLCIASAVDAAIYQRWLSVAIFAALSMALVLILSSAQEVER